MRGPAQASDPVVQYLHQLIDAIAAGKLLIPRFQRSLVWSWDRQSELLRSVKDGIPIGAVVIWRTTRHIAWQPELAGYLLPSPAGELPRQYLLDGLQRLSTLFTAIRGPDFGHETLAVIGYDLEDEVFVESFDVASQPQIVPLRALPDSLTLLRFQRKLKGERADTWIRRADDLAKSFREYKIPVISISSDDFEIAARTFNQINGQSVRMGEADMLHALTWTPDFELRGQLESLRSELLQPLGWAGIDFETVLRVAKAAWDLDLYEESVEQVGDLLKTDQAALGRAFEQLVRVAELLRDRCGILRWELVPHALQAVFLADALRIAGDRDVQDILVDWFWMTTYGEMFAGLSGHQLGHAVRDLRQTVNDGQLRWSGPSPFRIRQLPPFADFRAVRIKAVALLLARQLKDASGNSAVGAGHDPFAMLAGYGPAAMFPLVPSHLLTDTWFSSIGNRFLCHPTEAVELRKRLLSARLDEGERAAHAVSEAAWEAAQRGDWEVFVALRVLEFTELEHAFVGEILARHPTLAPQQFG